MVSVVGRLNIPHIGPAISMSETLGRHVKLIVMNPLRCIRLQHNGKYFTARVIHLHVSAYCSCVLKIATYRLQTRVKCVSLPIKNSDALAWVPESTHIPAVLLTLDRNHSLRGLVRRWKLLCPRLMIYTKTSDHNHIPDSTLTIVWSGSYPRSYDKVQTF